MDEKTKETETITLSDIRVSSQTAIYIMLIKEVDGIWNKIYQCVEKTHPNSCDKLFKEDFEEILLNLRGKVQGYIEESIYDKLGDTGNYSII